MGSMAERRSLSGAGWFIHDDVGKSIGDIEKTVDGWITASVPGNVQGDLEQAGVLKPLWYGEGDDRLLDACKTGWWYKKEFEVSEEHIGKDVTIRFQGVDYSCQIFINGKEVGTNEGMFRVFDLNITNEIEHGKKNTLYVHVDGIPLELIDWITQSDGKMSGEGTSYFFVNANTKIRQTLKGLKSPANCSYDWGTNIYTLGIWKDVELCFTKGAHIEWLGVGTVLKSEMDYADIIVTSEIFAGSSCKAVLSYEILGTEVMKEMEIQLQAGINKFKTGLKLNHPQLWWVHNYGKQHLYNLEVKLRSENERMDSVVERFGVRDVKWELCEGVAEDFPNRFQLVLNGVKIRTMGSNFVVPDLLYGRAKQKYRYFVERAKECNMNTLRQHGGQVVFDKEFYDAADELGVLLLVDFPIGNCVPENDRVFLENFENTIKNIVKQLRNHPSIIEWSGGNELDWYFNPEADHTALRVEEAAVYSEDDTRIFRATCPISGSRHAPWDYQQDITYAQFNEEIKDNFGIVPMMRYGEFGCQTPSNLETWHRDVPVESQWPINEEDRVLIRKNAVNAVFGSEFWLVKDRIELLFGQLNGLEMLIQGGQFIGAEGVRYMMDALRAKGRRVGGFTNWDYNEPWPNCAGSYMIDYAGQPLMMYYFVKQALAPVSLSLKYDHILYNFYGESYTELRMVSDSPVKNENLRWFWTARDRFGNVFGQKNGITSIAPGEVITLDHIKLNPPEEMMFGPSFIELTLKNEEGAIILERLHVFGAKGAKAPLRGMLKGDMKNHKYGAAYVTTGMEGGNVSATNLKLIRSEFSADEGEEQLKLEVKNVGAMTALFVNVQPQKEFIGDLKIEDNYIFIPPQESREIVIKRLNNSSLSEHFLQLSQMGWTIQCWNSETLELASEESVILSMGCRNRTCREYAGYAKAGEDTTSQISLPEGIREIECRKVSYLLEGSFECIFFAQQKKDNHTMSLILHTSDQDPSGCGRLKAILNGQELVQSIPKGLGMQKRNPQQLAYAKTFTFEFNKAMLTENSNKLVISTEHGWVTWDAMALVLKKGGLHSEDE